MIFEKHGLSVRIIDSDGEEIPEYRVMETEDNTIQSWIPSTEGSNFKIEWEIMENPHPEYDLNTIPYLDGVRMTGLATSKETLRDGYTAQHYREATGQSTARLYEFGRRILTDSDNCTKPDKLILDSLNTIKLEFKWGHKGVPQPRRVFYVPPEIGPIHEKAVKKGHSAAAKLGKRISIDAPNSVSFETSEEIKTVTFVFCYAPEDWLRARDIIARSPEPELQDIKDTKKRERDDSPDIIDIDDLETDDDEIQVVRHMIPAPVANKRQRTSEQGCTKKEEGQERE